MNIDNIIGYFVDPYLNNAIATPLAEAVLLLIGMGVSALIPALFLYITLRGGRHAPWFGMATIVAFFVFFTSGLFISSYPMRWNSQFKECQDVEVKLIYKDVPTPIHAVECRSKQILGGKWSDWKFDHVPDTLIDTVH